MPPLILLKDWFGWKPNFVLTGEESGEVGLLYHTWWSYIGSYVFAYTEGSVGIDHPVASVVSVASGYGLKGRVSPRTVKSVLLYGSDAWSSWKRLSRRSMSQLRCLCATGRIWWDNFLNN